MFLIDGMLKVMLKRFYMAFRRSRKLLENDRVWSNILFMDKVQILSCIAINYSIKSTPQAGIEIIYSSYWYIPTDYGSYLYHASIEIIINNPFLDIFITTMQLTPLYSSGSLMHNRVEHSTVLIDGKFDFISEDTLSIA